MRENHEDEWLRTVARQNEELDRARNIQPGRGVGPIVEPPSGWVLFLLVVILLLMGFLP